MLGRIGGVDHQLAIPLIRPQVIHPKERRPQQGIKIFRQKGLILIKLVILPDILAHPGGRRGDKSDFRIVGGDVIPSVAAHVDRPSAHVAAVGARIIILRHFLPHKHQRIHIIDHGLVAGGQVGLLCQPVIHLDVDVGVIIRTPGIVQILGPDSLQVGGQAAFA